MASGQTTPRQKMINLMYIVFLAMVAMNVSSDVLNGFKHVEDSLLMTNKSTMERNQKLYSEFEVLQETNPEKASEWYNKAQEVKLQADSLYSFIDTLKYKIVRTADGKDADVNNIKRRDNNEATNFIMISPAMSQGKSLRFAIDNYRESLSEMIGDKESETLVGLLNTEVPENSPSNAHTWESAMFENIPVSAAITILTKLQSDVRNAEAEAISSLMMKVDAGDLRVNSINAFVIPSSRSIIRGSKYSAQIVLAAIDSTQRPDIFINGERLSNNEGYFETVATSVGMQTIEGYIEVPRPDGTKDNLPFNTSYIVQEPTATVSNTMMNVMYAGIENPVSISVPGIPTANMSASMSNGTLTRSGSGWVAKPSEVGKESVITVTANSEGRSVVVANTPFRVRALPDPMPYIKYNDEKGVEKKYKGGGVPLQKAFLVKADGINAAIDDDLLNVAFRVLSFEMVFFDSMGNAIPELSDGSSFSTRQKESIRRLTRGKRFYISKVRAVGPDGVERTLSTIEVIVN